MTKQKETGKAELVPILVVDDMPENIMAVEQTLQNMDLDIVSAASGRAALKAALERDFAFIILDVMMPGMDGFETAALIRGRERSRDIPIIFLTGLSTTDEHVRRGYALGAVDYIIKPFVAEELRGKVRAYAKLYREKTALQTEMFQAVPRAGGMPILVVDDTPANLLAMTEVLKPLGERLFTAASGREALSVLMKENVAILVTDINMPGMDGFELAQKLQEYERFRHISVIFVTAINRALQDIKRGYALGPVDYIFLPCPPEILQAKIRAFLNICQGNRILTDQLTEIRRLNEEMTTKSWQLNNMNTYLEKRVLERTEELRESCEKQRQSLQGLIQVVSATTEVRDPYTAGHQLRVADLSRDIARELGYDEERMEDVHMAGTIHDLGKIGIPAEILAKPGKISATELTLIKAHAQIGYDIIKGIEFPWPIAQMIYQHHERLDGSGYPQGLRGEEILHEARIIMVADIMEAMVSHRPYRPALGIEPALKELRAGRGVRYDPQVVDICLCLFLEKGYTLE